MVLNSLCEVNSFFENQCDIRMMQLGVRQRFS